MIIIEPIQPAYRFTFLEFLEFDEDLVDFETEVYLEAC